MRILKKNIVSVLLCVVTLSSALPTLQRPFKAIQTSNSAISHDLFASLEELARIVDISYCVGYSGIQEPFLCASRCNDFPTFNLIKTWNTGPLLSDSTGYLAYDHSNNNPRIIVAFRGTYSIANTIADLSTMPQKYVPYLPDDNSTSYDNADQSYHLDGREKCENCTVHAGFLRSWRNTRDAIMDDLEAALSSHPSYKLHFVGHSLGGAVALLGSLELQSRGWDPIVTTFGEPRVGNFEFVKHVDERFSKKEGHYRRVTHVQDPVPLLPPSKIGYVSHADEIFIGKKDLPPEIEDLRSCKGDEDMQCSAAGDPSRLWQLFFAHRDYFWRIGLCIKGGDPWDWKGRHDLVGEEL